MSWARTAGICEPRQNRKVATVAKAPERYGNLANRLITMSYIVLARKWRPKTFDEVIGQQYITLALKNAITSEKLAHALIFSGPRGVGKTTTARIVAKALNCTRSDNENLVCKDLDNACSSCTEISESRSVDVLEIDAASHTGVDKIRVVTENVKYLPSSAKNKVYIIDEAHMLSKAAFNALLKTLEEPPGHVLFILATTEAHEIPATIRSRCQNYDFKKLSIKEISVQLERIAETEGITIDKETTTSISKESDGSIRDALSLMDQLIAAFGNKISYNDTVEALEILDKTCLHELLQSITDKDPKRSIETLKHITSRGIPPRKVAGSLTNILRDALFIRIYGDKLDVDLTDDDAEHIKKLVSGKSPEYLELIFSLAIENAEKVHRSSFPELYLETMIIRLATITDTTIPINKIIEQIEGLSAKLKNAPEVTTHTAPTSAPDYSTKRYSTARNTRSADEPATPYTRQQSSKTAKDDPGSDTFVSFVKEKSHILGMHLEKADSIDEEEGNVKIFYSESSMSFESAKSDLEKLKSLACQYYNKPEMRIRVELKKGYGPEAKKSDTDKPPAAQSEDKMQNKTAVEMAIEIFEGRIIK